MQQSNEQVGMSVSIERRPNFTVRRGFTVMEIVVAVALMAILTAITFPTISKYLSDQEIDTTASTLTDLKNAIASFRATVGNSPSRLTHLTKAIASTDSTSCTGRAPATPLTLYGATNAPKWLTTGPFYPKPLSVYGTVLPIGTASDTLFRTAASLTASFLNITIHFVRFQDADALNDLMDGPGDGNNADRSNSTGVIRWTAPNATERVDLTYSVSIGRVC